MLSETHFKDMDRNLKRLRIVTRPQTSNGLWLALLLPLSFVVNTIKLDKRMVFDSNATTFVSLGLLLQTVVIYSKLMTNQASLILRTLISVCPGLITSFVVCISFNQNILFSLICGLGSSLFYEVLYIHVLQNLPKSFTLGEAAVVVQGLVIFLFNAFSQLPSVYMNNGLLHSNELAEMKVVMQVGLIGVIVFITIIHIMPLFQTWILFYPLLISFMALVIAFPDSRGSPQIYILLEFMTKDNERILVICLFVILMGLAIATVTIFSTRNLKTTTIVRKIFHVLIILVFVPGMIYQCTLLYVTSAIMLATFCMLETIRIVSLPPFGHVLNTSVSTFLDEKDVGLVALTPIYLLIGCAMPLWIHPVPCDITDSAGINLLQLLSGILSVGVGDMAASIIGVKFGKHKWRNNSKTIEGTLASITFQLLVICTLWYLKLIDLTYINTLYVMVAIIVNALVEANTDQIDNLVLPLITFSILSYL